MTTYTVVIDGYAPDTPITVADRDTLANPRVVQHQHGIWQALGPAETVTGTPGTAAEIAQTALSNQTVAEPGTTVRVRVWEGAGADTSAEPAHTLISEEIGS